VVVAHDGAGYHDRVRRDRFGAAHVENLRRRKLPAQRFESGNVEGVLHRNASFAG
jgi:hypothetical protein